MKLKPIHLFLIILIALFFACCLGTVVEGYTQNTVENSDGDSTTVYTGKYGNKAVVTNENDENNDDDDDNTTTIYGPGGGSATTGKGPYGAQVTKVTGPAGNSAVVANPNGVTRAQIPPGDEDLYVLKSKIVPPVCPKCPTVCPDTRSKPPPPCPPCARCPEPAFDCKKVPNYSSNNDRYLPKPMLSDFSTFGS